MRNGVDCKGRKWTERKLSTRMRDRSGEVVGLLTILFPVEGVNQYGMSNWLCKCECGNVVVRQSNSLQMGSTNSCGCLLSQHKSQTNYSKATELIGQKFNKLLVTDIAEMRVGNDGYRRAYYRCICECDREVIVRGTDLKLEKQLSCGSCAKVEAMSRRREDLANRRFGKLVVTSFAYIKNKGAYWNCQCDCGADVIIKGSYLTSGKTSSCGCIVSCGEFNIMQILNNNNVKYLHNKGYFKDLVGDNGFILRYDFIIFNGDTPIRLVEFDGPQHDEPGWLEAEEFNKLQRYDTLKNQYALSHNIPLVRIPYYKRDNIRYEDIFENNFLIKGDF